MRELFKRIHPSLRDYLYLSSKVSDFTIGDYTFEIGGRKKGKKQIEDVETGHGIIIPLWYFGMNY